MSEKIEKKDEFKIQYYKGDTYALKITFKNVSQDLTTAFFTVKENADDETPLIEKTIGSGIDKIDENFYKNEIVYKLQLQTEDSVNLQADFQYLYDLKVAVGNVVKTVISGVFIVRRCVTGTDKIITTLAEIEVDDVIGAELETTPATQGIEYEQDPIAMLKIGDITLLNTTNKSNLVNAVNEVNTKASASAEEIEKIEDGTVSVPNALNADEAHIAQYASQDTSKGTIEERLTNLGFRQGSFSIVDTSVVTPAEAGTTQIVITKNEIKRQGNYCIGNFSFYFSFTANPDYSGSSSAVSYRATITIPDEFKANNETQLSVIRQNSFGIYDTETLYTISSAVNSFVTGGDDSANNPTTLTNAGWEAQPIE